MADRNVAVTSDGVAEVWTALDGFMPASIVATRSGIPESEWRRDDDRRFDDDAWLVGHPNELVMDGGVREVRFDALVDVGGLKLDHPSLRPLSIGKKLAFLNLCRMASGRGSGVAGHLNVFGYYFDWLIRFRLARGLARNADLAPKHFKAYCKIVSSGPLFRLVPIEARLDGLAKDVRSRRRKLLKPPSADGVRVDLQALSFDIGIPYKALASSREFRNLLIDFVGSLEAEPGVLLFEAPRAAAERKGDGNPIAAITLMQMLEPWEQLASLTRLGLLPDDPMTFDPFAKISRKRHAGKLGAPSIRTSTMLPEDLFRLLAAAVQWMGERAQGVMTALRDVERLEMITPEYRCETPELNAWWGNASIQFALRETDHDPGRVASSISPARNVDEAVKHLMTACAIVIAAFGARRRGEVTNLRIGCVSELGPNVWGLSTYIEKTIRDLDVIPVPKLVRVAVEILERLSHTTRDFAGGDWLFRIFHARWGLKDQYIQFDFSKALGSFVLACGLPPPKGQKAWNPTSRQLRRAFAVLYYHGNSLASLDDLSQHLRHFNPETTWTYVYEVIDGEMGPLRDRIEASTKRAAAGMSADEGDMLEQMREVLLGLKGRRAAFEEVRRETLAFHMMRIHKGVERPAGRGARKVRFDLKRMVEAASAQVAVGERLNDPDALLEPLERLLMDYARDHWLDPVPGIPVHCNANPNDEGNLESSICLRVQKEMGIAPGSDPGRYRPAPAFTADYQCLECVHCVMLEADQRRIDETLQQHEAACKQGGVETLEIDARARYQRLKEATRLARLSTRGDDP